MAASAMIPNPNGQGNVELPEFKLPPCKKNLWILGQSQAGQDLLKPCLDPFDNFWVTDSVKDAHLSAIRKWCDNNRDSSCQRKNILHCLVEFDDGCVPLLERLLKLGLDPNVKEGYSKDTPGHVCSRRGNLGPLTALLLCRADPMAENKDERTADDDAAHERSEWWFSDDDAPRIDAVNNAWAKFGIEGPLSVAQLAAEGHWFALQNICRRKVVPDAEKLAVYNGRNAIEWAYYYGWEELAEELMYFLAPPPGTLPAALMPSLLRLPAVGTSAIQRGLKSACAMSSTSSLPIVINESMMNQDVKKLKEELVSAGKREEELRKDMKKMQEGFKRMQDEFKKMQDEWKKEKELNEERAYLKKEALRLDAVNHAWANFCKEGPLSVARLASERKWFAVQNICRRRVVPDAEKLGVYQGKNAIEWANYYGEAPELVQELMYFLVASPGIVTPFRVIASPAIPNPLGLPVIQPPPPAVIGTSVIQRGLQSACTSTSTSSLASECLRQEVKKLKEELVSAGKREEELRKDVKKVQEELKKMQAEWKKEKEVNEERVNLLAEQLSNVSSKAASSITTVTKKRRVD